MAEKKDIKIGIYRAPEQDQYLNYNDRPNGVSIDTIVVHYTVCDFNDAYLILTKPHGVSSHYLIDRDGRVDNLVSDDKRAWHGGVSYWNKDNVNDFSIGIELVNSGSGQEIKDGKLIYKDIDPFPEAQMVSLVALIDYIKENHPIKDHNIVGHSDIAPDRKMDPGIAFNWKYLNENGHGLYPKCSTTSNEVLYKLGDKGENVMSMQNGLKKYGYKIDASGEFDKLTQDVVRAFNVHFNNDINDYEPWYISSDMILEDLLMQA